MTSPQTYPRSVTPGIETHLVPKSQLEPGIFVSVDWLRGTCSEEYLERVVEFAMKKWGDDARSTFGARHYRHGLDWQSGTRVSYGHNQGVAQLDVRGDQLEKMTLDEQVRTLSDMLGIGLRLTRIDQAFDFVGQALRIFENARDSCERDELCLLRTWEPQCNYGPRLSPVKLHLSLGNRESDVCARIYDKGLEQKIPSPGEWERIEAEFKGEKVREVAQTLAQSNDPNSTIRGLIAGAFDFRMQNGRSELARRPRCEWWSEIAGSNLIRPRPVLRDRSLEKWRDGFARSYGRPLLRLAKVANITPGALVDYLLQGESESQSPLPFEERLRSMLSA